MNHPKLGQPPDGDWLGTPFVRLEREGSLARCVIDRPDRRNAMTGAMYFAVRYAITLLNDDDSLSGLLITGTGDVFIPGGDMGADPIDEWSPALRTLGWDNTPFDALRSSRKPVVSAINGIAQGGGMMIAMLSDVAIAGERATFRAPELLRGISDRHYGQILPRQVGPARARDLLLTGRILDAHEAVDWGVVSRLAADDLLLDVATDVLAQCCRTGPISRAFFKSDLRTYYGDFDRVGMEAVRWNGEAAEGFTAFKERRPPAWIPEDLAPVEGGRL